MTSYLSREVEKNHDLVRSGSQTLHIGQCFIVESIECQCWRIYVLSLDFAAVCRQFQELRSRDLKVWGTALLAVYSWCKISFFPSLLFLLSFFLSVENCVTRSCWNVTSSWRVLLLFLWHMATCSAIESYSCCFGGKYLLNLSCSTFQKRQLYYRCKSSFFSKCHFFYINYFVICYIKT